MRVDLNMASTPHPFECNLIYIYMYESEEIPSAVVNTCIYMLLSVFICPPLFCVRRLDLRKYAVMQFNVILLV